MVFIDRITQLFQGFLRHKLSGAGSLLLFTVIVLLCANTGYRGSYNELLHAYATIDTGKFELSKTLSHWINDGLIGIFFFLIGLKIKPEFLAGELAKPRTAVLPNFGAVGGIRVPALVYFTINSGAINPGAINPGGQDSLGWGILRETSY